MDTYACYYGLIWMKKTNEQNMIIQLESLFSKFRLIHHVIAFVKDEGNNLTTMASTLHCIIDCEPLRLIKVDEGTWFEHVMSKKC